MKLSMVSLILCLAFAGARGQETISQLQAGVITNTSEVDGVNSGYRISFTFEFKPSPEKLTVGATIGVMRLSVVNSVTGNVGPLSITTMPALIVTRYMFGSEKLNGFVRVGLGLHSSTMASTGDFSIAGGSRLGAASTISGGVMCWVSRRVFLGADLEWMWKTNDFAFVRSNSLGIASLSAGVKF